MRHSASSIFAPIPAAPKFLLFILSQYVPTHTAQQLILLLSILCQWWSKSIPHCLRCVFPWEWGNGRQGHTGIWTHLPRLMDCTSAPLQGQGSSLRHLHFPMGKQTDWRLTARSTLQTDTPVWADLFCLLPYSDCSLLLLISQMETTR